VLVNDIEQHMEVSGFDNSLDAGVAEAPALPRRGVAERTTTGMSTVRESP